VGFGAVGVFAAAFQAGLGVAPVKVGAGGVGLRGAGHTNAPQARCGQGHKLVVQAEALVLKVVGVVALVVLCVPAQLGQAGPQGAGIGGRGGQQLVAGHAGGVAGLQG